MKSKKVIAQLHIFEISRVRRYDPFSIRSEIVGFLSSNENFLINTVRSRLGWEGKAMDYGNLDLGFGDSHEDGSIRVELIKSIDLTKKYLDEKLLVGDNVIEFFEKDKDLENIPNSLNREDFIIEEYMMKKSWLK
jgi:hypothetical protein